METDVTPLTTFDGRVQTLRLRLEQLKAEREVQLPKPDVAELSK